MMWRRMNSVSRFARRLWIIVGWAVFVGVWGCSSDTENSMVGGNAGIGGMPGGEAGHGGQTRDSIADREISALLDQALITPPVSATPCTAGPQCPTGYCVDGFCCDTKCDNKCMACSSAKKGSGSDGICGSIKYDTDPDNDCPYGACDGKNMCKNYNGFSCTAAAQCLSNYCVDGFCCNNICMGSCQACSAAKKGSGQDGICGAIKTATDPDNECSNGDCNGSGACTTNPQPTFPNGTACTSAAQCASGYCADGVCCDSWCLSSCQACTAAKKNQGSDGTCGPIANDKDPDEECWGGACNGAGVCKQYNGVPCSERSQCLSGFCVDGFCCGNICTGMCYACSEARKGGGYDGACGPILSGRDPDNECNPGECNGSGTCNQPQTPQANGTTCVSGGQCASGSCADGVCCDTACNGVCQACTTAKKGSGADGVCGNIPAETDPDNECGYGGRCGGNGTCRYYNGAACTSTSQCFSNYCVDGVCCGNICTNTCYACTAAKKGQGGDGACGLIASGRDPDNECNPGECNGSGTCNQPQLPQANGATCALNSQCISGFCVDNVCCDRACATACEACTAAKKGNGTNGTCGPIKYDTDPDNECPTGACSGTGLCQSYNGFACTQTSQCLSNYCVDGFCCNNYCGLPCYACSAAKKGAGYDGQCGVIANNTDPDNECGLSCNGSGACQKAANGVACMSANDCTSGFCVDGVCCNEACTGTCRACTAALKGGDVDGVCGNIAEGTDPQAECNGGKCTGAGACTLPNGSSCTNGNECTSTFCIDGVCCDNACNGRCMACSATKKGQGTNGTCGSIAGGTDPDDECVGSVCDVGGACAAIPCMTNGDCPTNLCSNNTCTGVLQVAVNSNTSCALLLDGRIKCWGSANAAGLGDTNHRGDVPGEMGPNLPIVDLGTNRFVKKLALGESHACALFHGGAVACWGVNTNGQLGRGDTTTIGTTPGTMGDNLILANLGSGRTAIDIAAGVDHTCAILDDHRVKCWGFNDYGQLGIGTNVGHGGTPNSMGDNLPAVELGAGRTAIAIAIGYKVSCAILDNAALKCWGGNWYGQLGLGDTRARGTSPADMGDALEAVDVGTGRTVLQIHTNYTHACARLDDGSVKCWGSNNSGQLGLGDNVNRGAVAGQMGNNLPAVDLGTGKIATQIAAAGEFSCALLNDGMVKCWGLNDNGESGAGVVTDLGDAPGEMGDNLLPVNLATGKTTVRFSSGLGHSCVILNDGSLKCWGYNGFGQLGLGDARGRGTLASDMGDNLPVVILQ